MTDITVSRKKQERRYVFCIVAMIAVCLAVAVMELSMGALSIDPIESVLALFGIGSAQDVNTVQSIRLPRTVCAIVSGAGLALAGAALQSVLENPLASASTVGISQGAAFGATVAILIIVPTVFGSSSEMGMTAIARMGLATPESIILVGVALSALWAGASTIMQYFSDDLNLTKVIFWQFGDLGRATWSQIGFMTAVGLLCSVYFFLKRWSYNALQNGAHVAGGLGVDVARTRIAGVFVASLMAATMVSFIGLVNFIGLIAPHIARRFVGNDYRFLLPASLALGATVMLASDLVARMIVSPVILPIGAITSFLGAPLFLFLLYKGYKR